MAGSGRAPIRTEGSRGKRDTGGTALAALGEGGSGVDGGSQGITIIRPLVRVTIVVGPLVAIFIKRHASGIAKWILQRVPIPGGVVARLAGVCGERGVDRGETGVPKTVPRIARFGLIEGIVVGEDVGVLVATRG